MTQLEEGNRQIIENRFVIYSTLAVLSLHFLISATDQSYHSVFTENHNLQELILRLTICLKHAENFQDRPLYLAVATLLKEIDDVFDAPFKNSKRNIQLRIKAIALSLENQSSVCATKAKTILSNLFKEIDSFL